MCTNIWLKKKKKKNSYWVLFFNSFVRQMSFLKTRQLCNNNRILIKNTDIEFVRSLISLLITFSVILLTRWIVYYLDKKCVQSEARNHFVGSRFETSTNASAFKGCFQLHEIGYIWKQRTTLFRIPLIFRHCKILNTICMQIML